MKIKLIQRAIASSLALSCLFAPRQVSAQIIPRPWASVGAKDSDVTYSVGARFLGFGVEVGAGPDGAAGVDVLKFINLPLISPYVGLGVYSADKGVAFSGGVQVSTFNNLFLGLGYNSVRGVNGQLGIRF